MAEVWARNMQNMTCAFPITSGNHCTRICNGADGVSGGTLIQVLPSVGFAIERSGPSVTSSVFCGFVCSS
eukprot:6369837-Amphidinium_carterae.1